MAAAHPTASFPIERLDLVAELRTLQASPMPHKQVAKTLVHRDELRVVLVALREGAVLAPHHASGALVIQVLEGRVVIRMLGEHLELAARQVLVIAPELEHSLEAAEDAAVMLTLTR